jgi:hypothetical protein
MDQRERRVDSLATRVAARFSTEVSHATRWFRDCTAARHMRIALILALALFGSASFHSDTAQASSGSSAEVQARKGSKVKKRRAKTAKKAKATKRSKRSQKRPVEVDEEVAVADESDEPEPIAAAPVKRSAVEQSRDDDEPPPPPKKR